MNKKKKRKYVTMTKKISWITTYMWILTIVAHFVVLYLTGHDSSAVVGIVTGAFGLVQGFYLHRSTKEAIERGKITGVFGEYVEKAIDAVEDLTQG